VLRSAKNSHVDRCLLTLTPVEKERQLNCSKFNGLSDSQKRYGAMCPFPRK
jgi:hypothetical protein